MKTIVIIGAGPAGLTAGVELLKASKEYEVVILEETAEIGGISRTVKHNGNRMDIGGHRFFSKDEKVNEWWNELMPKQGAPSYDDKVLGRSVPLAANGPDPEKEDKVMLTRNRVSRIYYKKKFFDYPVKLNWNTIKNMGIITDIQAGLSYMLSAVHKKEETSLENFYINRFGRKLYSMFFEGYTEKLWGRHPSEISADWGSQRVKGLSVLAIIKDVFGKMIPKKGGREVETSLIEEFSYPKYGPGQLWETAAAEFEKLGGIIKRNSKVVRINSADDKITGVVFECGGKSLVMDCDILISSMPVKDLVLGMESVPSRVKDIAAGLPYRDFVTVGIKVNKLNLKNKTKLKTLSGIVPDCWIYVQDAGVKLGRIQIFNNWSPYLVDDPEKHVWIGLEYFCTEGDKYWNMSEKEWTSFGIGELVTMGVLDKDEAVLDSHMERVKKAYPAYFDTYDNMDEVIAYLNGYGNLYCVGRNGQHRYNNMDHSMVTAFETVKNILSGETDKTNIWNVNTDKSYHETKKEEN